MGSTTYEAGPDRHFKVRVLLPAGLPGVPGQLNGLCHVRGGAPLQLAGQDDRPQRGPVLRGRVYACELHHKVSPVPNQNDNVRWQTGVVHDLPSSDPLTKGARLMRLPRV